MRLFRTALCVATMVVALGAASAAETIRVGVLKYGTVNWELDAMTREGLDATAGIKVEIVPFAGEDASNVALQAGSVDMIVSDWLWVSREREAGTDYTFMPYSTSVGSLMVAADSPVRALGDLKGKKIGVAGGPLDKNWLLVQAHAKDRAGIDLASEAEIVYGAPPLLMEKARSGELDAVLNYWHYAARLEAAGFRSLVSGTEAALAMGAKAPVAAIGWVFRESFARENPGAIEGFREADRATKALLKTSDAAFEALKPLMKAEDEKTFQTLRARYRDGIPTRDAAAEEADAAALYEVLARIGGERLVGPGRTMAEGTYWMGASNGG